MDHPEGTPSPTRPSTYAAAYITAIVTEAESPTRPTKSVWPALVKQGKRHRPLIPSVPVALSGERFRRRYRIGDRKPTAGLANDLRNEQT